MSSLLLFFDHEDSVSLPPPGQGGGPVGRAAGNSGQHSVSPAVDRLPPVERQGIPEPGSRTTRLDRPAAYTQCRAGIPTIEHRRRVTVRCTEQVVPLEKYCPEHLIAFADNATAVAEGRDFE